MLSTGLADGRLLIRETMLKATTATSASHQMLVHQGRLGGCWLPCATGGVLRTGEAPLGGAPALREVGFLAGGAPPSLVFSLVLPRSATCSLLDGRIAIRGPAIFYL